MASPIFPAILEHCRWKDGGSRRALTIPLIESHLTILNSIEICLSHVDLRVPVFSPFNWTHVCCALCFKVQGSNLTVFKLRVASFSEDLAVPDLSILILRLCKYSGLCRNSDLSIPWQHLFRVSCHEEVPYYLPSVLFQNQSRRLMQLPDAMVSIPCFVSMLGCTGARPSFHSTRYNQTFGSSHSSYSLELVDLLDLRSCLSSSLWAQAVATFIILIVNL